MGAIRWENTANTVRRWATEPFTWGCLERSPVRSMALRITSITNRCFSCPKEAILGVTVEIPADDVRELPGFRSSGRRET